MIYLQVFVMGLLFSFVGSIPPGTLNMTVLKLGLEQKTKTAFRFALAVALVEYPYAWIGVQFEYWVSSSPVIVKNFELITAIVMITMGVLSLLPSKKNVPVEGSFRDSGFRRGLVLSLLNPMAIPYWMAFTAYMKAQGWISLSTTGLLHSYVLGTSAGALLLLTLFIFLANRLSGYGDKNPWVKRVPGITLLLLGFFALVKYLA
jgi:threonine/homoserine/homoserine lactone efflux protein